MKNTINILAISLITSFLVVTQANADLVTENFGVEVIFGPGTGETGTIIVEYNSDDLDMNGDGELLENQIELNLNLFSQAFVNEDDIDFDFFPVVDILDGTIEYIDYIISESIFAGNPRPIDDLRIASISGGVVENGVWQVETEGVPVPEPTTFILMALGLVGLGYMRKKAA